jgi:TolA-binding protein
MNLFLFSRKEAVIGLLATVSLISLTACTRSVGVADDTTPAESASAGTPMTAEEKMNALSDALSKAQNRIEELDARLSAMSDRLDNSGHTTGDKGIKTEVLPGAAAPADSGAAPAVSAGGEASTNAAVTPADNEVITSFTTAMTLFKSNKFSDAELEFHKFTEHFPDHILAGSAQYYAGESYLMMGEYKLAANEYHKVLASFSSSPRLASAMVRLAQCQKMNGKEEDSSRTFSVAYNLFQGNPSLDYRAPEGTASANRGVIEKTSSASKLDSGPIDSVAPAAGSATEESTGSASNEIQE